MLCAERGVVPYVCSISDALCFVQDLLDKGTLSTVKVYLAAISACHVELDSGSIGQHLLVGRFMRGVRRLSPGIKAAGPALGFDGGPELLSTPLSLDCKSNRVMLRERGY